LAGAAESIKLAATRLVRDGPALGTRLAAADIKLGSSTSTSARANLDLLRFAGSVLDEDTASATVQWILDTIAAVFYEDIRQELTADILSGSADALHAFGDVRDLNPRVASELISSLGAGLREIISSAHKGLTWMAAQTLAIRSLCLIFGTPTKPNGRRCSNCWPIPLSRGRTKSVQFSASLSKLTKSQQANMASLLLSPLN
jgi:hypothetical protein